jgi:hypothetical protein
MGEHDLPGVNRMVAWAGTFRPSFSSGIFITPFSIFIAWISTLAKSAEPPVSVSGVEPLLWTAK